MQSPNIIFVNNKLFCISLRLFSSESILILERALSSQDPPAKFIFPIFFHVAAAAAAKSLQSCPTLCNPIDGSPPGSPVPGILQARTLEWVAISFSNASKGKVKVKLLSHVRLPATPWFSIYL